ncbi:MAG TPA: hypothetical protein VMU08_15710 [Rhizomicrobium sp.]|nr:hypothetical protein [Rhizomicrobium sp.]
MTAFDHVIVLLSFVYAIALTHLLSRIGSVINAYKRVNWSGLLALAVMNAAVILIMNWLSLLGYRNQSDWNVLDVAVQLWMAIQLYFWCFVALPEIPTDGTIDLEAVYWKQRRIYYIAGLVSIPAAVAVNLEYLKTPLAAFVVQSNMIAFAGSVPMLFAIWRPERWAQWLAGVCVFALGGIVTPFYYWRLI